jgi:hypothetical protein
MRFLRATIVALVSALVVAGSVYVLVVRPRLRRWGVDPLDEGLALPGDDLVASAGAIETRGVTIDAPPAAIWPWLVQMGYGRAGWYSYDALDNRGPSSERIVPELQHVAVGDVMPTHPGGGFLVKAVEPERALVLYSDTELVRQQAERAALDGTNELPTPGLKASGAMLSSFPEFAASWAFYLRPLAGGRTRLIERFRARIPGNGPASVVMGEVMGTGIILMTRRQLLGIKERVEATHKSLTEAADQQVEPATEPIDSAKPVLA